ncbi:MAG: alpha-L-arabinofuranosidase C-terminal domain-containing protein [Paludibacter sp.]|nr:alpha-L-arabinofuranosidase C-terminal domain-containing protein [Paludibacter sp.]
MFQIQAQPKLTLDLNHKGMAISPTHYGIFFEDINHAADGGLYAELIRNRSFEDAATLDYWTTFNQTGAAVSASIETVSLLNTAQTQALKLTVTSASATARTGIYNPGFWGINVVNGRQYKLTFFAKCDAGFTGNVTASLESSSSIKYAQATVTGLTNGWQKYTCILTASGNDASARFVLSTTSTGTIWFDVVSLFPPTFNNRENGLRPDLAQLLADMKPKFMRFPGGCFIEGDVLANRFQWKKTIGKIEERPGHYNLWAYRTSDGMGYHEFLQLCEDINTAPLYVVNVGLAHNDNQPYTALTDYIQDALDAIEYANGATTTTYGALRAANGHPLPFNLKFIEIGNENYSGDNYGNRYLQFYNAIKSKYPDIKCIGNVAAWGTDSPTWTFSSPVDLVDEHYYRSPQWFINQYNKYDTYSRNGPKVYAGEYAVTSGCGNGNMIAALGEAVYMAGMEKNSDIVPMNSYAPIFVNLNDRKWNPDMIQYNASTVFCTPSYYVQKLFATNIGTVNIPIKDSLNVKVNAINGSVGLGTWSTKADYSTLLVKNSLGTTLFSESFASGANWTPGTGSWAVTGGIYSQTATSTDCRSISIPVIADSVYTYSVKARKVSGSEGFLIVFGYRDSNNYYWWNIGGWGNTKHAIEQCVDGSKTVVATASGSITTNTWYDIRIEVSKTQVLCYLNDVLIHTLSNATSSFLYTAASLDEQSKQLYVKVINPSNTDVTSALKLNGVSPGKIDGYATVLTSMGALDENTLAQPTKIIPVTAFIDSIGNAFNYTFKGNSVTILKLNTGIQTALPTLKKKDNRLTVYPNPARNSIFVKGDDSGTILLEIRSLIGQAILSKKVQSENKIDISTLKSGAYIVVASQGKNTCSVQMIKE